MNFSTKFSSTHARAYGHNFPQSPVISRQMRTECCSLQFAMHILIAYWMHEYYGSHGFPWKMEIPQVLFMCKVCIVGTLYKAHTVHTVYTTLFVRHHPPILLLPECLRLVGFRCRVMLFGVCSHTSCYNQVRGVECKWNVYFRKRQQSISLFLCSVTRLFTPCLCVCLFAKCVVETTTNWISLIFIHSLYRCPCRHNQRSRTHKTEKTKTKNRTENLVLRWCSRSYT